MARIVPGGAALDGSIGKALSLPGTDTEYWSSHGHIRLDPGERALDGSIGTALTGAGTESLEAREPAT